MKLIQGNGEPKFGLFPGNITEVNTKDFDYTDVFGKRQSKLKKYFACNQFQFIGIVSPEVTVGLAIVDLKLVSNAFIYYCIPGQDKPREWSVLQPLARQTEMSLTPDVGQAKLSKGKMAWSITADKKSLSRVVEVTLPNQLTLKATMHERGEPLRICTKTGASGWTYTQKLAACEVAGELVCADGRFAFDSKSHALYDWSIGYMRRETNWNWASGAGLGTQGELVGLNFACGVNETSFTENCFWHDGKLNKIDMVSFDYKKHAPTEPWQISSYDNKVKLRFVPQGLRQERLNLWLMASNFKQCFGQFYGELKTDDNKIIRLDGLQGFVEDHYAKW